MKKDSTIRGRHTMVVAPASYRSLLGKGMYAG